MNYIIKKEFSFGKIEIDNFVCRDHMHFSFRVKLTSNVFNFIIEHTFQELVYWQLPFKQNEKKLDIFDECAQGCRLVIDKEYIEFKLENDKTLSINNLKLNGFEDQDKFDDLLIELNAICETIF